MNPSQAEKVLEALDGRRHVNNLRPQILWLPLDNGSEISAQRIQALREVGVTFNNVKESPFWQLERLTMQKALNLTALCEFVDKNKDAPRRGDLEKGA